MVKLSKFKVIIFFNYLRRSEMSVEKVIDKKLS